MTAMVLRWGVPAFVVVVGGTFTAMATTADRIEADLTARVGSELAANGITWPRVAFAGRDLRLSGAVASAAEADLAAGLVSAVRGVRSASLDVTVAPVADPYPLLVSIGSDGVTLAGGVPDEAARAELRDMFEGEVRDETELLAGVPDRRLWTDAVRYVADYAKGFDEGEAALSDLDITISGRASDYDAYEALLARADLNLPQGLALGFREIAPPLADPYVFSASFDGFHLSLSGVVPDEDLIETLTALVPAGVTTARSLLLASGAPSGFDETATLATQNLLRLHDGKFEISGADLSFEGTPSDRFVGEEVRLAMTPLASRVDLVPAPVAEYWFGVEKTETGTVMEGFVPDATTLERLAAAGEADLAGLAVGGGAPDRFVAGIDYVLGLLPRLSSAALNIQGTTIILRGRAATSTDYDAIVAAVGQGAPQGFAMGSVDILPPIADPYTFSAERLADGSVSLSGHVPDEATRRAVTEMLPGAVDRLAYADGAPERFLTELPKALKLLADLESGAVRLDAGGWSVTGLASNAQAEAALETAFRSSGLEAAGWRLDLGLPEPEQPLAVVENYGWRLAKSADGALAMSGYLPSAALRDALVASLGSVADDAELALGAAPGFDAEAGVAAKAVARLREGAADLTSGNWTLRGAVATTAERHEIEALVASVDPDGRWTVAVQADDAAPLVVPFRWEAHKTADGRFQFAGYVPTEQLRRFLATRAGSVAADATLVGSGEPVNFAQQALAGIEALGALEEGTARFDGRAWSLSGQPTSEEAIGKVASLLGDEGAAGPSWTTSLQPPRPPAIAAAPVEAPETEAAPEVAAVPADVEPGLSDFVFRASKGDGEPVMLSGAIPDEPARQRLAELAGAPATDALELATDLPADFTSQADLGHAALAGLVDGEYGLANGRWYLRGRAELPAQKAEVERRFSTASLSPKWSVRIELLQPVELCTRHIASLAARNAILFQSGSALLAESSALALDELASYLAECPAADVNIEGHTDSDGDADQNLALSVARAEAVVDGLIARGVAADRLYAIGYGESLPIADNDTRAGKQANRRIAFTVSEP